MLVGNPLIPPDPRSIASRRGRPWLAERRAGILNHRERLPAPLTIGLAREAHEALVLCLVVPVRKEHGHQAEGIDLGSGRSAAGGIDLVELPPRPPLAATSGNLRRLELAFDGAHSKSVHFE